MMEWGPEAPVIQIHNEQQSRNEKQSVRVPLQPEADPKGPTIVRQRMMLGAQNQDQQDMLDRMWYRIDGAHPHNV